MVITKFPGGQTVQARLSSFTDLWSFQANAAYSLKVFKTHLTFTRVISGGQHLARLPDLTFLFFFYFTLKSAKHLWHKPTFSSSFLFSPPR